MKDEMKQTVDTGGRFRVKKVRNGIVIIFIAFIVGFAIGVYVCVAKPWEAASKEPSVVNADDAITEENYTLTISNVQKILQPASDLISTKYYYTDADTYENYKELFGKRIPFTTDKVVFTYDGVISVGIDLSAVSYEIDNENQRITITLPEIKILSNEIDESSFEFPYMSNSVFNATEMDDYVELIARLKQEKAVGLFEDAEFMNAALANTKEILKNFLTLADATKEYEVVFL